MTNLNTFYRLMFPLLYLIASGVEAQSPVISPIAIVTPESCNSTSEYFDISHLECKSCPANSEPQNYYNCRCKQNFYFTSNSGGGAITCQECPANFIQSLDGYNCVSCDATCQNCAALGGYRRDLDDTGRYFTLPNGDLQSRCILCDNATSLLYQDKCRSCKPQSFIETVATTNLTQTTCSGATLISGGVLFFESFTAKEPDIFSVKFGENSFVSWWSNTYLVANYRQCVPACATSATTCTRNVTACQVLANICVMNLYVQIALTNGGTDACLAFNEIILASNNNVWSAKMPWLSYTETLSVYKTVYLSAPLSIILRFADKCDSNTMSFYSADYSVNGNLVSYGAIEIQKLQLCRILESSVFSIAKLNPFTATNYNESCTITAAELLRYGTANPIFYDIYLKYDSTDNSQILPIPVKTLNFVNQFNNEVNRGGDDATTTLQRRLFLVDAVSGKASAQDRPNYIRYAKKIMFKFELVEAQTNGKVYPPVIEIDYAYIGTQDLNAKVQVAFGIEYKMNLEPQSQAVWISIGIISVFSFLWTIIRTWVWSRRSGKIAVDIITLFKFLMYLISHLSNVFFIVSIVMSIYWLIFYKGQALAFVTIPNVKEEESYRIILIVAFFLKLIDVIHLILVQCSYDIFFIDWERPKNFGTSQAASYDHGFTLKVGKSSDRIQDESKRPLTEESAIHSKVSCWRTLFVANEWNEIQTFRKINPTFQLIALLFFLKVINLEALTTADCNVSLDRDSDLYIAPYSALLRIGMAGSIYIALGVCQYIIYNFIYIRCVADIIGQFIDFCSVSNISMFVMTHSQFGYYIHGRSPHGNADTGMQQMAQALLKEENDLSSKRGLEEGSVHQTFSISISGRLSKQYAKVMAPLYERKKMNLGGAVSHAQFEKRMQAYTQLNRFLIAFIDNILREMRYIVVKRNFFENVMNLELKEPQTTGYFYADQDKSFEKAIFCGQERRLFAFDLLLFLVIDLLTFDYVLAALVTFVVIKIYTLVREDIGRMNISRKTLVDKRFLI